MKVLQIEGIEVKFPFEPYACQLKYMEQVIKCLENENSNALLESPTGTGKTLCLLCATLGWIENEKKRQTALKIGSGLADWNNSTSTGGNIPQIFYTSRTHTQIAQVIKELKNCPYTPITSVRGSRVQLCVNEKARAQPYVEGGKKNETIQLDDDYLARSCKALTDDKSCSYFFGIEKKQGLFKSEVLDIEDMVQIGKNERCCPYYMSATLSETAEIVFMPYNYALDPAIRKINQIDLSNSILIIDEAHNIQSVCQGIASIDISTKDCSGLLKDLQESILKKKADMEEQADNGEDSEVPLSQLSDEEFDKACKALTRFTLPLTDVLKQMDIYNTEENNELGGQALYDIFELLHVGFQSYRETYAACFDMVLTYLDGAHYGKLIKGYYIRRMKSFLDTIFSEYMEENYDDVCKDFRIAVKEEENLLDQKKTDSDATSETIRTLCFVCLNPKFAMEVVAKQCRNLIITSGTLAPLDSFAMELDVTFDHTLENNHVIDNKQCHVAAISNGPSGVNLRATYINRTNTQYLMDLGESIITCSKYIPDGVLVFFPTYTVMNQCVDFWKKKCDIFKRLEELKHVTIEPNKSKDFNQAMLKYYSSLEDKSYGGAFFFGVCRGKVSEGVDFSDFKGRGVIVTGLPLAPFKDPKIILKKRYLDINPQLGVSGNEWYQVDAVRSVNQAVGRIIRHKNDFGTIIFLDDRYSQPVYQHRLSKWIRPMILNKPAESFQGSMRDLQQFFSRIETTEVGRLAPTRQAYKARLDKDIKSFSKRTGKGCVSLTRKPAKKLRVDIEQEEECFLTNYKAAPDKHIPNLLTSLQPSLQRGSYLKKYVSKASQRDPFSFDDEPENDCKNQNGRNQPLASSSKQKQQQQQQHHTNRQQSSEVRYSHAMNSSGGKGNKVGKVTLAPRRRPQQQQQKEQEPASSPSSQPRQKQPRFSLKDRLESMKRANRGKR